ncbi:ABC transporter family substrate-binding protein [Antrihabitans sp. YC2-6]|uniref:ABC transporter family substrate-binding protein n=1 Tax=Antrihabitans sp. YC2-6 TaxID=2799498 RepID=UPI0035A9AD57
MLAGFGRFLTAVSIVAATATLSGCIADPPPPIESTDRPNTPTAVPTSNTVVVAIDDIGIGFNPHLLADQSPATAAVASLVLPSVFRPAVRPDVPGATQWILDDVVMASAAVTAEEPFTVTYQIRNEAQWSDGAPIAAEDFRYLWQQMIEQPGAVDPAGYELIDNVASAGGGKTVVVTFKGPYPAWPELFANLLPSHLVKDAPGGFERGLAETIPVSGGHFNIKSIDRGRDEILLERNDRFWDVPAKPDQIIMRRAGLPAQLADSMRSGDTQIATVHGSKAAESQLSAIPAVKTAVTFQPRVLEIALNARNGDLADERVRHSLLSFLDPTLLAGVGAGSRSDVEHVRAQVLSPSDPGYVPTEPPRLRPEEAYGLLGEAGYVVPVLPVADGTPMPLITKNGKKLEVRIGVPENDDTAGAVASTVADQLRDAGFDASVVRLQPDELYGDALIKGDIDALVGWVRSGNDPATALASRFGCEFEDGGPDALGSSNLPGVCDPTLQPLIDTAVRGQAPFVELLPQIEPKLWQLHTVLPIMQDMTVVAVGGEVGGVTLVGPIQTGIFGDAYDWTRKPE